MWSRIRGQSFGFSENDIKRVRALFPMKKEELMKRLFFSILFVLISASAFTTAQFPDYLVYKGERVSIFSNPLESFFSEKNPRPDNLFRSSCTACWRGYIATWEVREEILYLVKVIEGTCNINAPEIDVSGIFGKKLPIKATWFSGVLRIPRGKMLSYVHMGYGSVYEKELFLTFENGKLINEEIVDNTKTKIKSEDDRTIEELNKLKEQGKKSGGKR